MTECSETSFIDINNTFPSSFIEIIQRDTVRKIMQYLQYNPNMIEKTLNHLGISTNNISSNSYETIDPRLNETNVSEKNSKKTKKEKKNTKAEKKTGPSNIQVAYRTFMASNTDMNNKNGIKYKLSEKNPNLSKKEIHTQSLKEISSTWKQMSADEKGIFASNNDVQLKKDSKKSPTPVIISDESDGNESDEDEECEEMIFGGKTYAVSVSGSEGVRSVYTMEGVEVGTYSEENNFQMF